MVTGTTEWRCRGARRSHSSRCIQRLADRHPMRGHLEGAALLHDVRVSCGSAVLGAIQGSVALHRATPRPTTKFRKL